MPTDLRYELDLKIEELKIEIIASRRLLAMLVELRGPVADDPAPVVSVRAKATTPRRRTPKPGQGETTMRILAALERSGEAGMTGQELATELDMPKGTASSRASILAREGVISHRNRHYFFKGPAAKPQKDLKDSMVVHSAAGRP